MHIICLTCLVLSSFHHSSFCGGYVDADDAVGSDELAPRTYNTPYITIVDDWAVKGLTPQQGVSLFSAKSVGSKYYENLLNGEGSVYEQALVEDGDLKDIVRLFKDDESALLGAFSSAWMYMMTADRFASYNENACEDKSVEYKRTVTDGGSDSKARKKRFL